MYSDRLRRGAALGTALFYQHQADPFQQLNGSVHSFGQKEIGARVLLIKACLAGKKNGMWKVYGEDGVLIKTQVYENGNLIKESDK